MKGPPGSGSIGFRKSRKVSPPYLPARSSPRQSAIARTAGLKTLLRGHRAAVIMRPLGR